MSGESHHVAEANVFDYLFEREVIERGRGTGRYRGGGGVSFSQ